MLKRFRNYSENEMRRQLRAAIDFPDFELHEKVRIADLIDIDKLDTSGLGTYALQAHFDFVVINQNQEAFVAFEFDGPAHNPKNDSKKDSICEQAGLVLFRVYDFQEVREVNQITLVRYLVALVFFARKFQEMKDAGRIAPDEPFMLSGFLKADAKHIFDSEFDFVANTNGQLTRLLKQTGLAADPLSAVSNWGTFDGVI